MRRRWDEKSVPSLLIQKYRSRDSGIWTGSGSTACWQTWSTLTDSCPTSPPGVLMDGDDVGKWLQQQKQPATWARLLPE
ncbi:hypothetical protein [Streptomyces sp. NPDC007369]|uniref:hypothetical protein n=1 Tax=Streptomyces sp. NPDC007369 TaxID=3154589 RepID=UPI0033E8E7CF